MAARVNLPSREGGHVEFKERLSRSIHLRGERRQQLASQMAARLIEGGGVALYVLGVNDKGEVVGLTDIEMEESISVLGSIASECGAQIKHVDRYRTDSGLVAKVLIRSGETMPKKHVTVAVAGHVNHGKSTLIACLITGQPDDGNKWLYLDTLPHEIERRLSAELHFAPLGFKGGKPLFLQNPLDREEKSSMVREAEKLLSFVDTVGHVGFLSTTIRGLAGQEVDYGLLVVAADDGPTQITKEHLGIMLGLDLPVIVCLTKVDRVREERVEEVRSEVARLLKSVGRVPFFVRGHEDVNLVSDKLGVVVPIIETSARTLVGYDLLCSLLSLLPPRTRLSDGPFLMYVDKIYEVESAGIVVSGSVRQGRLKPGSELLIGPMGDGSFRWVRVKSIETHYARLFEASPGLVVGVALRGIRREEVKRGMVLCDEALRPRAVRRFEAETLVLGQPTRISVGYEPVIHCHTIVQAARVVAMDRDYLRAGDEGMVTFEFKYRPVLLFEGDKFVMREGRTKGIGRIVRIVEE